jgi:ABC-type multidrug transport system ATPase subunit
MTVLSAERVGKRFGSNEALRDVSFSAVAGERLAVIGPNGAGKTTLLQILAGALEPDGGELELPPAGWVPQRAAVYSKLTVRENLKLFARLEKAPSGAVARMLELTGLGGDEETGTLSGGNRQRLNIAVGLLGDPPLLLLDEPSASLDPAQRERLWGFIADLTATVVFTTHDVGEAGRHADRLLVLADGELLFSGTPGELASGGDLETAFLRLCAGS